MGPVRTPSMRTLEELLRACKTERSSFAAGDVLRRCEEVLKQQGKALTKFVDAWESLPGGQSYSPEEVGHWMKSKLHPAVCEARKVLGRKTPG